MSVNILRQFTRARAPAAGRARQAGGMRQGGFGATVLAKVIGDRGVRIGVDLLPKDTEVMLMRSRA